MKKKRKARLTREEATDERWRLAGESAREHLIGKKPKKSKKPKKQKPPRYVVEYQGNTIATLTGFQRHNGGMVSDTMTRRQADRLAKSLAGHWRRPRRVYELVEVTP